MQQTAQASAAIDPKTVAIEMAAPEAEEMNRAQVLLDRPTTVTCPNCRSQVTTRITHDPGMLTWIIAAVLCLLGCWLCIIIPFCMDDWQDVVHYCPNCKVRIGYHKRM